MEDGPYNSYNRYEKHWRLQDSGRVRFRKKSQSGTQLKKQYYKDSDEDDDGNNRIKEGFSQL
jgi:hypothetical protein